jgi:N-methylhydantoinase A
VDVKNDYVQTYVTRHALLDVAAAEGHLAALREAAAAALDAEGFPRGQHRYARTADLRYFGQAFEVRVPVPDGPLDPDAVAAAFHDAHQQAYGYCFRDRPEQQVEWVNLRVTGIGPIRRPTLRAAPDARPGADHAGPPTPSGTRPVRFDTAYADTPVFWRPDLPPGTAVPGPAVIEEYGSTLPLHPGFTATVDRFANLVLTRQPVT